MLWFALPWPPEGVPTQPAQDEVGGASPGDPLGWWALRLTPRVARLEDALLLEVSGSLVCGVGWRPCSSAFLSKIWLWRPPILRNQLSE